MRVFILGASGMAGHVITAWLRSNTDWEVITHVRSTKVDSQSMVLDLYDHAPELSVMLRAVNPDVVINAVGILPGQAKKEPHVAAYLNTFLPHFVASKCRLIHISTDCVFSGKDHGPFDEASTPTARDIYGVTKIAGEVTGGEHLTIRTSIVGPEIKVGTGLFDWFIRQEGTVGGWTNALWNGVTTIELARTIQACIEQGRTGLKHLHAGDQVSKFELLEIFNEEYRREVTIEPVILDHEIDKRLESIYPNPTGPFKRISKMVAEQRLIYPHLVSEIRAFRRREEGTKAK